MNPLKINASLVIPFVAASTLGWAAHPLAAQTGPSEKDVAPSRAATNSQPAAMLLAKQIVALGYPEEERERLFFTTMDQSVEQMRSAIAPSLPSDDPGAVAILDSWIAEYTEASKGVLRKHIPDIMAGMEEAYATIFTVGELRDILEFVRTPSGQRYFELSPAISGAKSFADANQRYLDESIALLGPARSDLRSRLDEYMEEKRTGTAPADT